MVLIKVESQSKTDKDDKISIQASLSDVKQAKGDWSLTIDGKTEMSDNKGEMTIFKLNLPKERKQIEVGFTGKVGQKEVKSKFVGWIEKQNRDDGNGNQGGNKDQGGNNDQQIGGKLPKTANDYGFNMIVGLLVFVVGVFIFRSCRPENS